MLQDLSRMLKDQLTDVKPQDAAESARKMCQEAPARGMLGDRLRRRAKWRLHAKNQEGLVAKKVAFRAVCQDALTDAGSQFRLSQGALTALQWAGEEALATMFAKASLAAKHANRMTVYPKDVRLVSRLLPDDALFRRFSRVRWCSGLLSGPSDVLGSATGRLPEEPKQKGVGRTRTHTPIIKEERETTTLHLPGWLLDRATFLLSGRRTTFAQTGGSPPSSSAVFPQCSGGRGLASFPIVFPCSAGSLP